MHQNETAHCKTSSGLINTGYLKLLTVVIILQKLQGPLCSEQPRDTKFDVRKQCYQHAWYRRNQTLQQWLGKDQYQRTSISLNNHVLQQHWHQSDLEDLISRDK